MIRVAAVALLCMGFAPVVAQDVPVKRLLEEIEGRAASEPPVLGIDTQIRAAEAMTARSPEDATRLLRSAESRIAALSHLPSRIALLISWLRVQEALDADAAGLALRALAGSLPARRMNGEESDALTRLAERTKERYPEVAAGFLARVVEEPKKRAARNGPGLFSLSGSSLDGLSPDDVRLLARKERNPTVALDLMMHIMDDEEDRQRRLAILSEALEMTAKVEDLNDRLLAQSMLTRRLHDAGDVPRAAVGAQMLAETFERVFHCETAACDSFEGEDSPGEVIYSFAEYLKEHKIAPERLGLEHPSLRVRLLLLELRD